MNSQVKRCLSKRPGKEAAWSCHTLFSSYSSEHSPRLQFLFNLTANSLYDTARISLDFQNCGRKIQGPEHISGPDNNVETNPVGDWPWMASIGSITNESKWEHRCGATLITDRHFLTAAHCFKNPRLLVKPLFEINQIFHYSGTQSRSRKAGAREDIFYL